MPQIFPMNWLILTMTFMISVTLMMSMLYFTKFNIAKFSNSKKEKNLNFNYKW
nr:ATP synthase subunit 8 [Dermacentor reticulatus]WLD06723.1 ATP synthase subunit 8 [Dermacentor reticulatus]WLD06736.1 ATP synthase subunit 8 [Dermacentor reticulatus]WLD06749.1 ATP synthase subunit 8 [Dermacentor reticulatus]WLD06762.1 ATP synthase subunit 8 [Dermacentor reticulatus]